VIVEAPAPEGVYVTEHSFTPLVGNVQLAALNVPASPTAFEKLTVPEGRLAVPAAELSETVAVHVEAWLIRIDAGTQVTLVDESRFAADTVSLSLLVKWAASPP
jgi:hypothetical protein